jgi:hypothetical protein
MIVLRDLPAEVLENLCFHFCWGWIVGTALTAIQFRGESGTILTRALWDSGLTSADSGLQLVLGDRAKRCLSEDPAPAAYSAVPKIS